MKPFPLVPWLEAHGVGKKQFAEENGLSFRTVYGYCNGEYYRGGSLRALSAIEAGTDGEVTLRQMIDWMEATRAEKDFGNALDRQTEEYERRHYADE